MDSKTLTEIDFYRIRQQIAEFCVSQEGQEQLLKREPLTELNQIEKLKLCSAEWCSYLSVSHSSPFGGWEPVQGLFAIIHTNGAALNLEQVKALGQFITSAKRAKEAVSRHSDDLNFKALPSETSAIPELEETERKIFRIITPDGEMRDLPEISAIRRQIAGLNAKLKNIFTSFTSDSHFDSVLESSVPVLRNGRQVLAVKANQQNRIKGIIHEVSGTGQTVFIEPEEAVLCSNELVQKQYELQAVIKRILTELTAELQSSIPVFSAALPVMLKLDTTLAAARYCIENNGTFAQACGPDEPPLLIQARHPLLGQKAVPIDVRFMSGKRVLIITGPNTGGKTVTLKTFALFAMLNQAGFPILAAEGTRLTVFTDVFADIGDEQSLDQSLSTFSGHMKNIAAAVRSANNKTLVLLDELGSGTDPQEGTAIAMAVLDELISRKAFVLVTTHQGILKNYGYTNPCCINASVEFDSNTLSPSYRLLMGIPGESHALDIAKKSGLPKNLCDAARKYIATEQADVSSLIKGLNKKHSELDKLQRKVENLNEQLEDKEERQKQRELELRRRENDLKKGKLQELNDFLIHSRRQLENLVRTLKEGEVTRDKTLGVKQFIAELEKNTEHLEQKQEAEEAKIEAAQAEFEAQKAKRKHPASNKKTKKKLSNAEALKTASSNFVQAETVAGSAAGRGSGGAAWGSSLAQGGGAVRGGTNSASGTAAVQPLTFAPGTVVESVSSRTKGVLVEQVRNGVWQVQFGSVKMNVKQKDLRLVQAAGSSAAEAVPFAFAGENGQGTLSAYSSYSESSYVEKDTERPAFELRLLGMRGDEAIKALEHQIDLCILNNFLHFSVIHGKGEGVLQQMVTDYLSNCPNVKDFSFAPEEDGGYGKTYVTLK